MVSPSSGPSFRSEDAFRESAGVRVQEDTQHPDGEIRVHSRSWLSRWQGWKLMQGPDGQKYWQRFQTTGDDGVPKVRRSFESMQECIRAAQLDRMQNPRSPQEEQSHHRRVYLCSEYFSAFALFEEMRGWLRS